MAGPLEPLCFVLMPFGIKPDGSGSAIDFDAVYRDIVEPGIRGAEMQPIRGDEAGLAGIIHKPTYERLILCDYAVADLTIADAGVFYGLGVRHAIRPETTIAMFRGGSRVPFEVADLPAIPYLLDDGRPAAADEDAAVLRQALDAARREKIESPLFQLVNDLKPANISRLKTDVFRDQVEYAAAVKLKLAEARADGIDAVDAVRSELGDLESLQLGIVVDLFLSYRAVKGWQRMVELVEQMPAPVARSVMVREQLALALNRLGRSVDAEHILLALIDERGPSSETYGLLGRVYKDRWHAHHEEGNELRAIGDLTNAIDAYVNGFEADWRDAYPGINAVTLMEFSHLRDPRQGQMLPVVRYSAMRRVASGQADYWDHATLLELAVLASDERAAVRHAQDAIAMVRETWEPEATLRNLLLIRAARNRRGEPTEWMQPIEEALEGKAAAPGS